MSDIVKFENVVKEYKSGEHILTAIDHIDFTIEEGEFVVILGQHVYIELDNGQDEVMQ